MRLGGNNEERRRVGRFARGRWGRARSGWDRDDVAAHLMGCHDEIVRGLGQQSPWAGMDDDTRDSCFHHAAAFISDAAESGKRPDWRSFDDLERAQVSAFRHQALDHWKRVNALSRRGDRLAVEFDPERHIAGHAPIDLLFEQADLATFERDLLAELTDDRLRAFWTVVIGDQVTFKEAGDRLGLSKAGVMATTRAGRSVFSGYLARRETGELCRERGLDIAADRAGRASGLQQERAAAHLEGCYACALVHEPNTSAFDRGILGLAPTGLILRLVTKLGDASSVPALRFAESGSGSRAVAAGLAAVTVAGAGVGVSVTRPDPKPARPAASTKKPSSKVRPSAAVLAAPAPPVIRRVSTAAQPPASGASSKPKPRRLTNPKLRSRKRVRSAAAPAAPRSPAPAVREFGVETPAPVAPAPKVSTSSTAPSNSSSPAADEFLAP